MKNIIDCSMIENQVIKKWQPMQEQLKLKLGEIIDINHKIKEQIKKKD